MGLAGRLCVDILYQLDNMVRLNMEEIDGCSNFFFQEYFLNEGEGFGIPRLYVKFWWPLFLTMKFTFLFLNLAKIHSFIPKSVYGAGTTS